MVLCETNFMFLAANEAKTINRRERGERRVRTSKPLMNVMDVNKDQDELAANGRKLTQI
jgi:hypothetical protein